MAKLANARDLKSCARKGFRVRSPVPASWSIMGAKKRGVIHPDHAPLLRASDRSAQKGISSVSATRLSAFAGSAFAGSAFAGSAFSPFGGQITPSHERSRHLKSGALGL